MNLKEEFRKEHPETIGEEDSMFDLSNYCGWMEGKLYNLINHQPFKCPVCGGNGLVPAGFYNTVTGYSTTTSTAPLTCRSCNGTGIVWK